MQFPYGPKAVAGIPRYVNETYVTGKLNLLMLWSRYPTLDLADLTPKTLDRMLG